MSRIHFGTLSRPFLFPKKDRVARSGAGGARSPSSRGKSYPLPQGRARNVAASEILEPSHFRFGVAAHAGNEAARFEDEVTDGAVELRRRSRGRERERHAQAGADVRDFEAARGA